MKQLASHVDPCIRRGVILTCYINGRKFFRVAPCIEPPAAAQSPRLPAPLPSAWRHPRPQA